MHELQTSMRRSILNRELSHATLLTACHVQLGARLDHEKLDNLSIARDMKCAWIGLKHRKVLGAYAKFLRSAKITQRSEETAKTSISILS